MNKIHAFPWFPLMPYFDTIKIERNITDPAKIAEIHPVNSVAACCPMRFANKTNAVIPSNAKRRYSCTLN
jgi:hypothetical protein